MPNETPGERLIRAIGQPFGGTEYGLAALIASRLTPEELDDLIFWITRARYEHLIGILDQIPYRTPVTMAAEAEQMARAGRRLREVLQPADDVEEFSLEVLCQVVRVNHIRDLAEMAERASRREPPR